MNNYYKKNEKILSLNKIKQNEENKINKKNFIDNLGTKSDAKNSLRKSNYQELSESKKMINMKISASYNLNNNKINQVLSLKESKKELAENNNKLNNSLENNESDDEK